jgi:hypothetical protein
MARFKPASTDGLTAADRALLEAQLDRLRPLWSKRFLFGGEARRLCELIERCEKRLNPDQPTHLSATIDAFVARHPSRRQLDNLSN